MPSWGGQQTGRLECATFNCRASAAYVLPVQLRCPYNYVLRAYLVLISSQSNPDPKRSQAEP